MAEFSDLLQGEKDPKYIVMLQFEVLTKKTNVTFTFLYNIDIMEFTKLLPVGIELTTRHHWFISLMLIQLC